MNDEQKVPSTGKYIGVWVLVSILAGIGIRIIDTILANALITPVNVEASSYWVIAPVLEFLIWAVIMIAIYSAFSDLLVSKVVPWMFGLGGLGVAITIFQTLQSFQSVGLTLPKTFIFLSPAMFITAVLFVRWYFKTKQPHRY